MKRLAQFLLWVDYKTDGIRLRLFVAAAFVQVFLAPLWDRYVHTERFAAQMELPTLVATLVFLALTGAMLGGRLLSLSSKDEPADERQGDRSVRRVLNIAVGLVSRYWRLMRMEPWPAWVSRMGAGVCITLMALRGACGLVRWTLWKGMRLVEEISGLGQMTTMRSALTWVHVQEQAVLKWVVLASIPLSLFAAWAFLRKPPRGAGQAALRDLSALAGIDPVLDRRNHDRHSGVGAAFNGDLVARVLRDIGTWEPARDVCDEQTCRDDLAFFLRERGHQVGIERWIEQDGERRRVDILLADSIAIEMKYALHEKGTGERDRARAQVECYARLWAATGPVFLLLAATPSSTAERFSEFASHWNANLNATRAPVLIIADPPNETVRRLSSAA